MIRSITNAATHGRRCAQLAFGALATSRVSTTISVALVTSSVLLVVGAERTFVRLADVVVRLADGTQQSATIDVSRCPRCLSILANSRVLREFVHASSTAAVVVHRVGAAAAGHRRVPVHCISPSSMPVNVSWRSPADRQNWTNQAGAPAVLVGAALAPHRWRTAARSLLHTSAGTWSVAGVLHERPALSADAALNSAMLVPWAESFRGLCQRGVARWQLFAPDSARLQQWIAHVVDELRTAHRLRPQQRSPFAAHKHDRFAALVGKLVRRLRLWILAVPAAIAVLCGAGIFSVQALDGAARIQEFGVRRAVGATRRSMIGQLVFEASAVCALGISFAGVLLYGAGVLQAGVAEASRALLLAVAVAVPLSGLGLLVPGLSALRASSIAALEGRGDT